MVNQAGELVLTHPEPRSLELTPMDLLEQFVQNPGAKDAVEAMTALIQLQREERDLKAKSRFNECLALAQSDAKMVVNDSESNPSFMKGKRWATYKALDKALRPIWTKYGFSLDFSSEPSAVVGQVIFTADLSLGSFIKTYKMPSAVSGDGAKGGGALSPQHAMSAGMEYGRKNLLKMIFNVITGEEEELMTTNGEPLEILDDIKKCGNVPDLKLIVKTAFDEARKKKDGKLMLLLADANDKRMKELQNAAH
jgi:hypothetical protein